MVAVHARHQTGYVAALLRDMPPGLHYRAAMTVEDDPRPRLAELIRTTREDLRWTQDELADRAGVSRPTVQRYENGKTKTPESAVLARIFKALGLDRRELAAILGILSRDELALPPQPARILSARTRDLLELLEDPDLPDEEKDAYAEMLRARLRGRRQRVTNPRETTRRDTQGIG